MAEPAACSAKREIIYRHSIVVRAAHWINVLCLALLLMSGLRIFNAHPALYWGHYGYRGAPYLMAIGGRYDDVTGRPVGEMRIGDTVIETTGFLGVTYASDGTPMPGAFPGWVTLGADLALARDWHFLIAWLFVFNGAVYLVDGLFNGHFRRDFLPGFDQLHPRHVAREIWNHLRFRRARGKEARRYNLLQKLSYLVVVFLLLPAMVLSGLTMSPAMTSLFPFLFDLFAGRQSARTIHFIAANLLVLFVLVHVFQVLVSGVFNLMASMITGRYAVKPEGGS
jgi:thiosulfate reductase cytochrome b subunit